MLAYGTTYQEYRILLVNLSLIYSGTNQSPSRLQSRQGSNVKRSLNYDTAVAARAYVVLYYLYIKPTDKIRTYI